MTTVLGIIGIVSGVGQMVTGLAGDVGGGALCASGVGIPAGVAVVAGSTTLVVAGAAEVAASASLVYSSVSNFGRDVDELNKSKEESTEEYVPPEGGGGVTSSVKVGDKTVTFGHGGRHLEDLNGTGLTINEVNDIIANDVVKKSLTNGFNEFNIEINGNVITYRAFPLENNRIHIGTYFRRK